MPVDDSTVIFKYDTVNTAKVFLGFVTSNEPILDITEELLWHRTEEEGYEFIYLTLAEIYAETKVLYDGSSNITVVYESPLDGVVYQCNNYEEGEWFKIGVLYGYA